MVSARCQVYTTETTDEQQSFNTPGRHTSKEKNDKIRRASKLIATRWNFVK